MLLRLQVMKDSYHWCEYYALSRNLSPALVAEYETRMIPRQILREKLHEWRELLEDHVPKEDAQL